MRVNKNANKSRPPKFTDAELDAVWNAVAEYVSSAEECVADDRDAATTALEKLNEWDTKRPH